MVEDFEFDNKSFGSYIDIEIESFDVVLYGYFL